jgi:hypothetical protein
MGLSKQQQWMIGEAILGTVVGAINSSAGIVLTFGLVDFHLCFDKNQQEVWRCPLEQTLNARKYRNSILVMIVLSRKRRLM